ncbi:hypothetical protein [Erysipelatoclostridium sp. An15]|uniref:hypothetical protein n=1 Tax=Erysipelatoclostridium sp. An15 TaxID=1965566 RepID=UPI001EF50D9A|nr:hypothetical protein [Erysipelatoclostridium sp. An15]
MLTIPEYNLLMKSVELKQVDKSYWIHLQAYKNLQVKAEKKVGKNITRPVYNTFKKFFDYENEINKVLGLTKSKIDKFKNLKNYMRRKEK